MKKFNAGWSDYAKALAGVTEERAPHRVVKQGVVFVAATYGGSPQYLFAPTVHELGKMR